MMRDMENTKNTKTQEGHKKENCFVVCALFRAFRGPSVACVFFKPQQVDV